MTLFSRRRRSAGAGAHRLLTQDALALLAKHGKARYDGVPDVWDTWPSSFSQEVSELSDAERQRFLTALVQAVKPDGGWAAYGAEDVLGGLLGMAGSGGPRDELAAMTLSFQRAGGVWWSALSPAEQVFWQQRHPGETWLASREPPSREAAQITPLQVGAERKLTTLTRAPDARATYVTHVAEGRYVWQLEYLDDDDDLVREDRAESSDLYELYWRLGRNMPFPGLWADPELEPFLPYPLPRL